MVPHWCCKVGMTLKTFALKEKVENKFSVLVGFIHHCVFRAFSWSDYKARALWVVTELYYSFYWASSEEFTSKDQNQNSTRGRQLVRKVALGWYFLTELESSLCEKCFSCSLFQLEILLIHVITMELSVVDDQLLLVSWHLKYY